MKYWDIAFPLLCLLAYFLYFTTQTQCFGIVITAESVLSIFLGPDYHRFYVTSGYLVWGCRKPSLLHLSLNASICTQWSTCSPSSHVAYQGERSCTSLMDGAYCITYLFLLRRLEETVHEHLLFMPSSYSSWIDEASYRFQCRVQKP